MNTAEKIRREMQEMLEELCAPLVPRCGMAGALHIVARELRCTSSQAKRLRYGEIKVVPAHLADSVRQLFAEDVAKREIAALDALLRRVGGNVDAEDRAAVARVAHLARAHHKSRVGSC